MAVDGEVKIFYLFNSSQLSHGHFSSKFFTISLLAHFEIGENFKINTFSHGFSFEQGTVSRWIVM